MPNRVLNTPVTELDFDGIKQNLKDYLATSGEFADFDYEGSGINILLDLLAYNTHYTGMYANMLAAESFMDSAVLRRSIVSLAKNLGYVPNSKVSARAELNLSFGETAGVPNSIPQGTKFLASKDGQSYTFSTTEAFTIDKTSVPYTADGIIVRQGVYKSASFIYNPNSNSVRFEIPSTSVDKTLTKIYVMSSPSDLTNMDVSWRENTDYLELTPTSKVYFINENYRGNYEVSFGDGILGAKPAEGSYITVIYFDTDGSNGNDIGKSDTDEISSFSFAGINGDDFNSTVTTVTASYGGSERDSEEKVRYTAPKFYQAQDRTVTTNDYEATILREYSAADSVRVWGGEQNDPPTYGKVFISILPKNGLILSDAQKESLKKNILEKKKIVTITPEILDPDYTYILINCFATYDSSRSLVSETLVKESIAAAIRNYSTLYLGKFNSPFRYSVISRLVDLSSNSIVSNRITTKLAKKIIPSENPSNYILDFGIQLYHPYDGYTSIVKTSTFKHRDSSNISRDCFIEDDGFGKLVMYTNIGAVKTTVLSNVGTIDYQTGKVSLIGFRPTGTGKLSYISLEVTPDQRFDLTPKRNQVLRIDQSLENGIVISMLDSATRNT